MARCVLTTRADCKLHQTMYLFSFRVTPFHPFRFISVAPSSFASLFRLLIRLVISEKIASFAILLAFLLIVKYQF